MSQDSKEKEDSTEKFGLSDVLKKVVTAGFGAAFMTEESIRNYVGDLKLPKDVMNLIVHGAQKSKEEMVNVVTGEVLKIIRKIDFVTEASRFVEEHKFKITAEIDVIKKNKERV